MDFHVEAGSRGSFNIDAIAASLYTEGKTNTNDDDPYSHPEMALEM